MIHGNIVPFCSLGQQLFCFFDCFNPAKGAVSVRVIDFAEKIFAVYLGQS